MSSGAVRLPRARRRRCDATRRPRQPGLPEEPRGQRGDARASCRRAATSWWPTRRTADVIVVNTCAFIDRAKQESIDTILEMAREKETGRARRLVVTGCLAQRYDAELRREIPEIDATLGTGQVDDIVRAVEGEATRDRRPTRAADLGLRPHRAARAVHAAPTGLPEDQRGLRLHLLASASSPRCAASTAAAPLEDVVAEARGLAARGVQGAGAGRAGLDALRAGPGRARRPGHLLRRLGRVDGMRWIRVMYAYPATVSDRILDAIAAEEKVVKYVDIPLQHASDAVLRAHEAADRAGQPAAAWSSASASACPAWRFRTSFIVGLPGRDRRGLRGAAGLRAARPSSTTWASSPTRTRRARRPSTWPAGCRARRQGARRKRRLMAAQKRIAARRNRRAGRGARRGAGRGRPPGHATCCCVGRLADAGPRDRRRGDPQRRHAPRRATS